MATAQPVGRGVLFQWAGEGERRILVIGKTGHGKSATANTILGGDVFKSSGYGESETTTCGYGVSERFGKKLVVVDTPGVFDTRHTDDQISTELIRSCAFLSPGPHAILLVLKTAERYTKENQEAIQKYFKLFGQGVADYMFLILSHWDQAPPDAESPENYIRRSGDQLNDLKDMCKGGCFTIINKIVETEVDREEDDKQVERIIDGIDSNSEKLRSKYFTSALFTGIEAFFLVAPIKKRSYPGKILRRGSRTEEDNEGARASDVCIEVRDKIRSQIDKRGGLFTKIAFWFRRRFQF